MGGGGGGGIQVSRDSQGHLALLRKLLTLSAAVRCERGREVLCVVSCFTAIKSAPWAVPEFCFLMNFLFLSVTFGLGLADLG